jgi:protein TonB
MRHLVLRVLPLLGALLLGLPCVYGVLHSVLRMNRQPMQKKEPPRGPVAEFDVRKRERVEPRRAAAPPPRRPPTPSRPLATAALPTVGVALSGIDVGLAAGGVGDLGDLSRSLADPRKGAGEVVMTREAVDTLPRPLDQPRPQFPERLQRQGVQTGQVVVSLVIGVDGAVRSVQVVSASHPELEQAVLHVIRTWRFDPARYQGQPVQLAMRQTIHFNQG